MKIFCSILMISLAIIMTACSTITGAATPDEPTATPGIVAENYANALPVPSQLALGTINLKGTGNAITTDQAANLLFLWKGMQAMAASSSASQLEVSALQVQIQDAMKPEQLQAITELKLTQADVQKVMADLGPAAGGGPARAAGSGASGGSSNRGQQGGGNVQMFGGPGGGAVPGGAGGGGGNQSIPPSTQATIQARAAQTSTRGNALLYTAVVNYLQTLVTTK